LTIGEAYGTIGLDGDIHPTPTECMTINLEHRIRLTDADVDVIVSALRARAAATIGARGHRIMRLAARLDRLEVGNPKLTIEPAGQEHED